MDLTFVDELPGRKAASGGANWRKEVVAAMRARPGVWLQWPWKSTYPKKLAEQIGQDFEIERRIVDDKTVTFVINPVGQVRKSRKQTHPALSSTNHQEAP